MRSMVSEMDYVLDNPLLCVKKIVFASLINEVILKDSAFIFIFSILFYVYFCFIMYIT